MRKFYIKGRLSVLLEFAREAGNPLARTDGARLSACAGGSLPPITSALCPIRFHLPTKNKNTHLSCRAKTNRIAERSDEGAEGHLRRGQAHADAGGQGTVPSAADLKVYMPKQG